MRTAVFSAKPYDRTFLGKANSAGRHELLYIDSRLTAATSSIAEGAAAVCLFANDHADADAIGRLAQSGIKLIALRAAGFDNVDLNAAGRHSVTVCRVPAYSPNAVAEHAFALILSLVRKTCRAYDRIREGNFSLDGLLGFDLAGKTIGIVGVGKIGSVVAQIARGFGCDVIGSDPFPSDVAGVRFCALEVLLAVSDIVTLHCPLSETTRHLIDAKALGRMKPSAILVNTSRGAVIDTRAVIDMLEVNRLGGLAIDVYEKEADLFFEDHSGQPMLDGQFARLLSFPNVLVTGHQGFLTAEALTNIAETTIANLDAFERTGAPLFPVSAALTAHPA